MGCKTNLSVGLNVTRVVFKIHTLIGFPITVSVDTREQSSIVCVCNVMYVRP